MFFIVSVFDVVVVGHVDILVVQFVFGLPGHLVLLLETPTSVGEPGTNL